MKQELAASQLDGIYLSQRVTVRKYRLMEEAEDRSGVAKFLFERFMERYVVPLDAVKQGDENGFFIMGSMCLLVESITAFREGWPSTEGLSERAFHLFFGSENYFSDFRGLETDFWKGVRCGILHQGETSHGWRLNFSDRNAPLLEPDKKRVNCFKFKRGVEQALQRFRDELVQSPWKYEIWRNVRKKMAATIKDCEL